MSLLLAAGILALMAGCTGDNKGSSTPTPTATTAPTATAAASATDNNTGSMTLSNGTRCTLAVQNAEGYPGPTTGKAKQDIGLDVQRLGTECSAFVFRDPTTKAHDAKCPNGYVCTFTLADGSVKVFTGDDKTRAASSGTIRWIKGYPSSDKVHEAPPCKLARAEDRFGNKEDPSFVATAGNFSCGASSSSNGTSSAANQQKTAPAPSGGNTSGSCDPNKDGIGGSWTSKGGNAWGLNGQATVTGNSRYTIHTPEYPGDPGLPSGKPENTAVATAYCK